VPDEQVATALVDQALHPSWLLAAEDGALTFPQFATPLLAATASMAIWDRYLGYGAALGVATAAVHALPMGAEDDHRAWSALEDGGGW
jgi:hypothetical protein